MSSVIDHRRIIKGQKGDYGRGLWLEVGDVIRLRCLSEGLARRREMNFICKRQLFRRFAETDAAAQRIKFRVWLGFLSGCKVVICKHTYRWETHLTVSTAVEAVGLAGPTPSFV